MIATNARIKNNGVVLISNKFKNMYNKYYQ